MKHYIKGIGVLTMLYSLNASALTAGVSGLSLLDMKTGQILSSNLTSGAILSIPEFSKKCLSIRASVGSGTVGSVGFSGSISATENKAPYDLMGDNGERGCLKAESYSIKASSYSSANLKGTAGKSMSSSFSLRALASITGLSLIDMKSGQVISSDISPGSTLTVTDLENKCLSIRANLGDGEIGSVSFTGPLTITENKAPFDLMGDSGERGCLKAQAYTVKATSHSEANALGVIGNSLTRSFSISSGTTAYIRKNLLREETYDRPLIYPTDYSDKNAMFPIYYGEDFRYSSLKDYSFGISTSIKRKGNSSSRFETKVADKNVILRSEAIGRSAETDKHRWYGLSMYLPKEKWGYSDHWDLITQFWATPDYHLGEKGRNPPIELVVLKGKLILMIKWDSNPVTVQGEYAENTKIVIEEDVTKILDKWIDFVWHIDYSHEPGKGTLELWMNGQQKVKRINLPNSFNDAVVPYFKFGLYNYSYDDRVIYIDEVRVGNGSATYKDVAP